MKTRIVIIQTIKNQQGINLELVGRQITLSDALFNNKTLNRLCLWNNQVGDKGVQSLSK